MPDIEKQIAQRVEAFVAELSELLRKAALQQAAEILAEQANAPGPGRRGRKQSAGSPRRNGRRTPAQLARLTDRLLAEVTSQPGRRIEEIAKSMAVPTKELVIPTRRLLDDNQIASKGTRRATRYFPKSKRSKGS